MASAHHPAHHARYSLPPPPNMNNDFRLPSLKDLNFQYRPPPSQDPVVPVQNGSPQIEHVASASQSYQTRHDSPWARPPQTHPAVPPQHQQSPPLSAGHDHHHLKTVEYSVPKHDNGGYLTPGIPLSAQVTPVPNSVTIGPGSRGDDSAHPQNTSSKRTRAGSAVNVSRDARPSHQPSYPISHHPSYPPAQQAPQYHQVQPPPPPPEEQVQHQTSPGAYSTPGYGGYPPTYIQPRQYSVHQPQQQSHHQSHHQQLSPHTNSYHPQPPPPSQETWDQHQQHQHQHQTQHQPPQHHQPPPQHQPPHHEAPQHHPPPHHQPPQHHQPAQHHQAPPHHQQPPHHQPTSHHQQASHQSLPPHHQQPLHQQQPSHLPPPSHQQPPPHQPPPPHHQHPPQQQQQQHPPHQHVQHHQQPAQHQSQHYQSHPHIVPPAQHHPQQPPPPPPPSQHVQSQPPPQPQHSQQQQQMGFSRTTPLVPTTVDARPQAYPVDDTPNAPLCDSTLSEIVKRCTILYEFANRYAQIQRTTPNVQPRQEEIAEMTQHASEVVRLLEEFRRMSLPGAERTSSMESSNHGFVDEQRPPKRPWEDIAGSGTGTEVAGQIEPAEKGQSAAEKDMEIIRTKRATSAAGAAAQTGQPKSKYRKRSSGQRATPPGKCHSCNIRETPEWRRGPDGARTLCNACGLHYAKLVRKRDKAIGADGQAARIDMETLRASARASELAGDKSRAQNQTNASTTAASTATTEPETKQAMPLSHHQGSFQVIPIGQTNGSSTGNSQPSHQHHQHHASHHHHQQNISPAHDATLPVPPPPPWTVSTPAGANRNYASDQLQHQSFMRTSHSVSSGASPH